MTPKLEIHHAGEWAALYVDGKLDCVGDAYNTEERAFEVLGVRVVQDDAFMRGQDQRSGVAPTLNAVHEYAGARFARQEEAARLRTQAAELITRANELEKS